jgi:hypothetical protein
MAPRRRTFRQGEIAGVLALCLSSCGGPGKGGPPPKDGLIIYQEPRGQSGLMRKGELHPMRWVFVTGEKEIAQEAALETRTGVIEGAGGTASSPEAESLRIARLILAESGKGSTMVLSRERFGELWGRLDAAGLFELSPHLGQTPPPDEPYFLLEDGSAKRIFARPSVTVVREDDPGIAHVRRWQQAKIVFFDFLNER